MKTWLEETMEIVEDMREEVSVQEVNILGKVISVHPQVFSPKYFADALFFAKEIPKIVGQRSYCEVGVGSGIPALFVALNEATKITGTDINPLALANTRENFDKNRLAIELYQGNVLDPIPRGKKFDTIFWNHPFNKVEFEVEDDLLKSVLDKNFEGLETFFATAGRHLNKDGSLILGTGELADQNEVLMLAEKYGWKILSTISNESKVRVGGERPINLFVHEFKM